MKDPNFGNLEQAGLWIRGGSWSIEWSEAAPSVPSRGSSRAHPERALTYHLSEGSDLVYYDPLNESPPVYLAFANLGQVGWVTYGSRFLMEWTLDPDIPEPLRTAAGLFISTYGPPVNPSVTGYGTVWVRSLHTMLRQAQLVDLAVQYQRVIMGEEDTRSLRDYMKAVQETVQHEDGPLSSRALEWGLDSYDGLLEATEESIDITQRSNLALGGLKLAIHRSQTARRSRDWRFELRFEHLLNAIWYQTYKSIVVGTLIRICRNARCDKPGRLFEAARTNQWYCDARCRNTHNTWRFRHPANTGLLQGILP